MEDALIKLRLAVSFLTEHYNPDEPTGFEDITARCARDVLSWLERDASGPPALAPKAAPAPRDPHAMWWVEHQRLDVEYNNAYLIRGGDVADDDEEHKRQYERLVELEDLLINTPTATFEGAQVLLRALRLGIADGRQLDDLREAFHNLGTFLCEIEHVLERHGLREQVLRWFWECQVASAPIWKNHPGKPADAEEIWRSAHRYEPAEQPAAASGEAAP